MKLIAFFSRFTFLCNCCFVLFVFFSWWQSVRPVSGTAGTVRSIPFFKDLVILLGFSAIVINLVMAVTYLVVLSLKKTLVPPKWLSFANLVFLLPEFLYFFFYK